MRLARMVRGTIWLGMLGALAVLALEGFFRLVPGALPEAAALRLHWDALTPQTLTVPDPDVGYLYTPDLHGRMAYRDFGYTYTTDAHGFRNPSPWPDRAAVVILGDSQAFSYGVADDQTWPRLLEQALPDSRVITLGLIWATLQQDQLLFEKFGAQLDPKLVILSLFPPGALNGTRRFAEWLEDDLQARFAAWRSGGSSLPRALLEQSYVVNALRAKLRELASPYDDTTLDFADGSRLRLTPTIYGPHVERADPQHPDFQLMMHEIAVLRSQVEAAGAQLLVLLIPTKEEIYLPLAGQPTPQMLAPVAAALERAGFDVLDPSPAFTEGARAGRNLFFEIDIHPNVEGYRLIAGVVADYLRANAAQYGLGQAEAGLAGAR